MPNSKLREIINKADLTAREKQTIEKLMANMNETVFLSGQQMAAFCDISATSMTRLIQKLGYDKFGDFKEDFKEVYRATITPYDMFEDYLNSEHNNEIIQESSANTLSNMNGFESMIDEKTLYEVARVIAKARKVYVVGMFSSEVAVRAIGYYMYRVGKNCEEITGLGMINRFEYSNLKPGDVLIAVSTQRIVKEIIQCVDRAREEQMISVALTDTYTNPLAKDADYVLTAPVKGLSLDCSPVALISLINILMNLVASEMGEEAEQNLSALAGKYKNRDIFCI